MSYRIATSQENTGTIKLQGEEVGVRSLEDDDFVLAETTRSGRGPLRGRLEEGLETPEGNLVPLWPKDFRSKVFWSKKKAILVEGGDSVVTVCRRRLLPFVLLFLALLTATCLAATALTGQNPVVNGLDYMKDATGIEKSNPDPKAEIKSYTKFVSTPDTVWTAGERDVPIKIQNPEGNPVDIMPSIYVDFNGDGELTEGECVFNLPSSDADGNPVYSGLISPGSGIDKVSLSKDIPAGKYKAAVFYTAVRVDSHQKANGMTMWFNLEVK